MALFFKILVLLYWINFVPPVLAHFLAERWNTPIDGGRLFRDGQPLLGPHKTVRGLIGAIGAGWIMAPLLGMPWWLGALAGALSMLGDLVSSFVKRRLGRPSGDLFPVLDQIFEGLAPFALLGPYYSLTGWEVTLLAAAFGIGAYLGSFFLKEILLTKPFAHYPRPMNSMVRLREIRSCEVTTHPLHHLLNFEDAVYYHIVMKGIFRLLGIYGKGKLNALQIQTTRVTMHFPDLPSSFDGYTILFASDLHLDGLEGLTERIQDIVRTLPADLCILGGDLRMDTYGPFDEALSRLDRILPEVRARDGILGVLGNHDCTEIIDPLRRKGVNILLNDSAAITRNGESIWIVGADDPHYYKCHDLEQAFSEVPASAFTIFVAHSNEIYREAASYSPQLYLCGHTHAGQIQLPGVGALFTHSSAPRKLCEGAWEHGDMIGYTSSGVGTSGIPVRFATSGEVLLVTLKRTDTASAHVQCGL